MIIQTHHLDERFWSKVNKSGPVPKIRPDLGPCWLWTGGLTTGQGGGRGRFTINGRRTYVYIWTYEEFIGSIPDGMEPDHLCRVPACCNPLHLEAVTRSENVRRGIGPTQLSIRNVERHMAKTHCPQGHEYTPENTYVSTKKNGCTNRHCRTCVRERSNP